MLNDGHPMIEVIKELQITEATWYRWINQYGSEKNAEASKRTKELAPMPFTLTGFGTCFNNQPDIFRFTTRGHTRPRRSGKSSYSSSEQNTANFCRRFSGGKTGLPGHGTPGGP